MKILDTVLGIAIGIIALFLLFVTLVIGDAWGDEFPNCAGWINRACCCTNNCCFEVESGTVEHLGGNKYLIVASGQIVEQSGWSRDGRFMRCACDLNPETGQWDKTPKAFTRCLFPPMPNS